MEEAPVLKTFKSKKNTVQLVKKDGCELVIKTYSPENLYRMEIEAYVLRRGKEQGVNMPEILGCSETSLVLSHIPGETALETVSRGGKKGKECVTAVIRWLSSYHMAFAEEQMMMGDCNLRNFILGEEGRVCGVDFEEARVGDGLEDLGVLCAHILAKGDMFSPYRISLCKMAIVEYSGLTQRNMDNIAEHIASGLEYFGRWRPDGPTLMEKAKLIREKGLDALEEDPPEVG